MDAHTSEVRWTFVLVCRTKSMEQSPVFTARTHRTKTFKRKLKTFLFQQAYHWTRVVLSVSFYFYSIFPPVFYFVSGTHCELWVLGDGICPPKLLSLVWLMLMQQVWHIATLYVPLQWRKCPYVIICGIRRPGGMHCDMHWRNPWHLAAIVKYAVRDLTNGVCAWGRVNKMIQHWFLLAPYGELTQQ